MNKRFTALMTTLILSVFFAISASAYDVEVDGIYYNLNSQDNVAEVTRQGYELYRGNITIPSSISVNEVEYPVTSIGERAFYECRSLTSITIPNSVTSIGESAFEYRIIGTGSSTQKSEPMYLSPMILKHLVNQIQKTNYYNVQ